MEKIIFSPEGHKYTRASDGIELMSVSHFRKLFVPTNWEHNVQKSAAQEYLKPKRYKELKDVWENKGRHILDPEFITYLLRYMDKKTFQRICKETAAAWKGEGQKGADKGTIGHQKAEERDISTGFSINPFNGLEYPVQPHGRKPDGSNESIVERLSMLEPGFYPELLLWFLFPEPIYSQSMKRDICGIAGTADKPYIEPDRCMIGDYKFTKKPLTDFAFKYKNYGTEMMTGPFSDWPCLDLFGYRIQLNTYGWMLDKHGLPPADLRIHNDVAGKQQEFVFPYEPWRVEEAVDMVFIDCL